MCFASHHFGFDFHISSLCNAKSELSHPSPTKVSAAAKEPYNRNTSRFIISELLFIHQLDHSSINRSVVALLLSQQACVQSDTNFLRERLAKSAQGSKSNDSPTQSPMGVVRVYVIRVNPESANLANKDAAF
eukprot:scaffold13337_cov203-Alexandrium_tamarense.AAC.6